MANRRRRNPRWWQPVLIVALGLAAFTAAAQPANDNFASATVIAGVNGTTAGDNTLATLEPCETNVLSVLEFPVPDTITNSVWYAWTAPASGFLEVDTSGSTAGLDFVLAVWTSTNLVPTLCDGSLTNLVADDGYPLFSTMNFAVVAGTTYYIQLSSYDDGSSPADNAGAYVLNWTETVPVVPTGAFQFTTPTYVVSQSDSTPPILPDGTTVDSSILGARITVTRPAPAYGRVLVDYTIADGLYTNILMTNYYGTNVIMGIVSTDTPPIITFSNTYSTNIVIVQGFQQYANGYFYTWVTNYFTNSVTLTENVAYSAVNPPVNGPLIVVATNMPVLTNFPFYTNSRSSGFTISLSEHVFGLLESGHRIRGTNYADGVMYTNGGGIVFTNYAVFYTNTYITNVFGTNLALQYASSASPGPWYNTNYYYTNFAVGLIYASNNIYTNGSLSPVSVLVTGTNWNVSPAADTTTFVEVDLNATNVVNSVIPLAESFPAPTNWPTAGFFPPSVTTIDSSGNVILTETNDYAYLQGTFATVPSASQEGFLPANGTLVFSNLQMSADIIVPVSIANGPDSPMVRFIAGYAPVMLSNPRLDPQENPYLLQAPVLGSGSSAYINALSPLFSSIPAQFIPGQAFVPEAGVFNFERSTFRTRRSVDTNSTHTITISVYRSGGVPTDSASVDYIIDPDYPGYYAMNPNNNIGDPVGIPPQNLYDPANTFPLQAGSDYATPNTDFVPITGTLNWGAQDFQPKQINIVITNSEIVQFNSDLLIQLHNANPLLPTSPGATDQGSIPGQVNQAIVTILADDIIIPGGQYPGQQPAGAADRSWNKDLEPDSVPPNLNYPGTTPGFGGTVYAVAEEPDGTALFAGSFVSYDSTPYNRIVRVLPNGYLNLSAAFWQGNRSDLGNNSGANDEIAALALQPDGQILIGGAFTAYNGSNRHGVARLNPDGTLDTTFAPGLGANGLVDALALQPNGQILIAGAFTSYNGMAVNQVARLNADGSLDSTFVSGVLGGDQAAVAAVAVDAAGRVLIGGNFMAVGGVPSGAIARLNVDGSLDSTFTPGIGTYNPETTGTDPVKAIAVQADGRILIGGAFANYNLVSQNGLARLNPDGTLDLSFASGIGTLNPITGDADTVNTILLQPDGNILIGGDFVSYNQTRRLGLARVFLDGSLDTSFMDPTYNHFAGVPNLYFNQNVVSPTYPYNNTPNAIYAIALETNSVTTSSNILIGGTFELVGGGFMRDDVRPRSNVARVIGGATPGPGNIEMVYNNYSVANSEGSLYVSLVRTNGNLGAAAAVLNVTTAAPGPGVATAGTDFYPSSFMPEYVTAYSQGPLNAWDNMVGLYGPNSIEIPVVNPLSTAADVFINVANPGNISGNLSANLRLTLPSSPSVLGGEFLPDGTALGANYAAPLTIIDSNVKAGVLGFSSANYLVVAGGVATITLTRTNGSQNQVTVYYRTTNGTGTNTVDYTGSTNQLTFGIGVTNLTFTVPTTRISHLIQPDKTVNLSLFTPSGGATLGVSNATLVVVNNNYQQGHLAFSAANYSVNENAGSAVVTVNRLGGSTGTLGVTFKTADVTAASGVNYLGLTTNLVWNNGDATSRTITIPLLDDGVVTPNLIANLILTNSTVNGTNNPGPLAYGNAASPTNATLTVVNVDSAGSFQFSQSAYSVKKYAGYALVPVTRAGGSVGSVQVSYTTVDGSAVQGTNYTAVTNTLTFATGQVSELIRVPILDDGQTNNPSGPRALLVQLSNPTGSATLGTPNPATLYIIDSESVNEPPGTPETPYTFGFNNSIYTLALQTNNQLVVGGDFTMADGVTRNRIARLNSDGALDVGFSLPADTYGANASVRSIAMQQDNRILVGGFFTNLNNVARGHIARLNSDGTLDSLFNPGSGSDGPVYAIAQTFVGGASKVLVGGAFATISGNTFNGIGQLNPDGTPDSTFNPGGLGANNTVFALAVQPDGKIVIGGDFTAYNGLTNFKHFARLNPDGSADTTFNVAGTGAGDSVRAIAIQLDGKILIGGLFTNVNGQVFNHFARLNADGSVDAAFNPQPGANAGVFAIGIQSDTRIVLGGAFSACNGVTRNSLTRLNPDGTVDPTINFGAGANDAVAAIAIQADTIVGYPTNVPDEKILIGGSFTQFNGATNSYLSRIYGGSISGSGAFQFSSAYYQVDEDVANVVITVQRTGGTTNSPTGDIFITATTADGSARAGVNYSNITATLDFPLGEVTESFNIPIYDDGVVTPNLTVNLAFTNLTAPAQIGNQPTAVLTIINDDSTISLSSPVYSVPKNIVSGVAPITVIRSGGTNRLATVDLDTTTNGTALLNTDYTPVSQTLTFSPGVAESTVFIPINNNGLLEGNQTVTMQLSNVIGSKLTSPTNATLTIIDTTTSPGQLFFSAPAYTATSEQGFAYLTVLRTNGSSGTISVTYNLIPGTALPGINYVAASGTLTFNPGITSQAVPVQLVNSGVIEAPASLNVVLSNPTSGATLVSTTNALLTIYDTNAVFAFTLATNTVSEDQGAVTLVVQRFNNTNIVSSVNYSTTNMTALANTNFIGVTNGLLTFSVGVAFQAISIPLINQSNLNNLVFGVNLANPVNAQLVAPSNTVVILEPSAAGVSFTTNATAVFKNVAFVPITVVCSNPRVEPLASSNTVPLEVSYTTVDGTAKAGFSYNAVHGTILFTNGLGTNTFNIPILNNQLVSSNLTFSVVLTNVTTPGYIAPYGTETVTIDESNEGMSFSQPSYTVFKNSGLATITVNRTGFTNNVASVDYLVTNGTAIGGQNFYPTNGTLVFTNGVLSQTFTVTIIDNAQVQPNLFALMELLNPTNAYVVKPGAATLAILENGGSYIAPAGSLLLTNSSAADMAANVIGSNDTVQVLFAFRSAAGFNVTNLTATLLVTNGVVAPSPASQLYTGLQVYGHSVSRPFSFTAHGTNSLTISPMFQLTADGRSAGFATFVYTLGTWNTTFANTNTIVINDYAAASPYPSLIEARGLGTTLIKATVTLTNLSHQNISDLDALVVSPGTSNTLVMAHAGGGFNANHLTLTFDDAATNSLPQNGTIVSGTNKPTQYYPVSNFP